MTVRAELAANRKLVHEDDSPAACAISERKHISLSERGRKEHDLLETNL